MTDLTLLHTANVHCATFDRLAPDAAIEHVVRPDWLERAQGGMDAALRNEITQAVAAAQSPVLCTCTTIGEAAENAGATRIDWPMMLEAARIGGPVLMVYCLESTRGPSETLLKRAFGERDAQATLLYLKDQWPLFETGRSEDFARAIAEQTLQALRDNAFKSVVLAQASMTGAAEYLEAEIDLPILTSPRLAVRACLKS